MYIIVLSVCLFVQYECDNYTSVVVVFKKMFLHLGSTVAQAGDLKNEMSQSGFSAVFHKVSMSLT